MKNTQNFKMKDLDAYRSHPRCFRSSKIIYPVLSRRSSGISIGVNLNPDKSCNFKCLYCQVHRGPTSENKTSAVSLKVLEKELRKTLELVHTGQIYQHAPFDQTPLPLRRLNDIALCGDGEPTAAAKFLPACRICTAVKEDFGLEDVKIILITNSSLLHLPRVKKALEILDRHQGQVWAKLDAGTENYFKFVNQTSIPFRRIMENILLAAKIRPVVIQSLFFKINGQRTPPEEIAAYAHRLAEILDKGGRILAIQLYSIVRKPRSGRVSTLSRAEIDQIAREIKQKVNLPLEKYYP